MEKEEEDGKVKSRLLEGKQKGDQQARGHQMDIHLEGHG